MSRLVPLSILVAAVLAFACDSSTPGPGQVRVANLIPDGVPLASLIPYRPFGLVKASLS